MSSFWGELKRRNVVRVAIAYAVVSWLLLQVADVVLENIEAPTWVFQAILLLLVISFPMAIIFAWAFELTPEGLKKEKDVHRSESITHITGRKLDFVIIGVLVVAVGFPSLDRIYLREGDTAADEVIAIERQSIAVLPFVNMSSDPDQDYFSDGLSEEILNLLANHLELKVIGRTSSFAFKNEDPRIIGDTLGVKNVLEGSVRKSGDRIRVTVQLIDASNGAHIWSESYDGSMTGIFAVQDDVTAEVVNALKLTLPGEAIPKAMETTPEAYALYLQGRHFARLGTPDGLSKADELYQQTLAIDPDFTPAQARLGAYGQVDQILEGLAFANIAFNAPRTMNFDDTAIIQLLMGSAMPITELEQMVEAVGDKEVARIRVSDRMEARLSGPNFAITAVTPEVQAVTQADITEWKWEVKPVSVGRHHLHLTLSGLINVDGVSTPRAIRTFDKEIEVEVTLGQQLGLFLKNNFQWLWVAILLPVVGWLWRRKKKSKPNANGSDS